MKKTGKTQGFTLIELMIVVAIVGILAAIAYPSYQEQVRKGKRADATGGLLNMAQQLERCYTQYNAYNDPACTVANALQGSGLPTSDQQYTITGNINANLFTLTATPDAGSSQIHDTNCNTFSYDSSGSKGVPVGSKDVEYCW